MIRKNLLVLAALSATVPMAWAQSTAPATTRPADEAQPKVGISARYDTPAIIRADLKEFTAAVATLAPDEAAAQWLSLADRVVRRPSPRDGGHVNQMDGGLFAEAVAALPPPASWDALAKAVAARPVHATQPRRDAALRAFVALLVGDTAAARAQLPALHKRPANQEHFGGGADAFQELEDFLAAGQAASSDSVVKSITARIDDAMKSTSHEHGYVPSLDLPDLVTLVGQERADELLTKALAAPAEITIGVGDRTRRAAQALAVANVETLAVPQWRLVDVDSTELYEAMLKRFPSGHPGKPATKAAKPKGIAGWLGLGGGPEPHPIEWRLESFRTATLYYMLGLIVKDRTAEATTVAKELAKTLETHDAYGVSLDALTKAGHGPAVRKFLHALLAENPDLPYWPQYTQLAASTGAADEMLQLARAAAARPNLSAATRATVERNLLDALLAADKTDEAIPLMRRMIAAKPTEPAVQEANGAMVMHGINNDDSRLGIAIQMAKVGRALDDLDLVNEAVDAAQRLLAEAMAKPEQDRFGGDWQLNANRNALATLLLDMKREPEAIKLLEAAVPKGPAKANAHGFGSDDSARQRLVDLAAALGRAGRHKDVLALLDASPSWQAADLAEIYKTDAPGDVPLGYVVAAALAAEGRNDEAKKTVDAVLDAEGGFDPAYELRVALGGDDLLPRLDALFSRDAFEERPLIWKAVVLYKAGKLVEAEAAARAAIAIDPSDGEQGAGDRMRVYAVLADVSEAKGHANDAKFFRDVVAAIRISERADAVHAAGLVKRATAMYNEALTKFADAYCIQSRLARQYAEMGLTELAEKHYKRAYELMPDSFGRMESHCFGCEGAFKGDGAQKLAEQVFTDMLAKNPDKPQLHYLLGYLRQEQDRYEEAAALFKEAVRLDPLYLNAWRHLADTARHVHLPAADRDAAILTMLKLDPLRRHVHPDLGEVHDLRDLWDAVTTANAVVPPAPDKLLPLPASAKAMKAPKAAPPAEHTFVHYTSNFGPTPAGESPAKTLAGHDAVRPLVEAIDGW